MGASLGYAALVTYRAPGPLQRPIDVVVPKGAFAATLHDANVVGSAWVLRGFAAVTRWQGPVHAAELSFPAGASVAQVLFILRQGRPVQHLVTVPEGVTSARVGRIMAGAAGLEGEIVLPDEGTFLPESYAYALGGRTGSVLRRGQLAMAEFVEQAWSKRAAGLPLRSARELVILASLVERETHLPGERGLVAAVFINRLRLGMRLQADSTVEYAAGGGANELGHGLRRDELARESPYNTYLVAGLPAGPICDPGAAAILAAAHPGVSDALYFVADGSGGHVFARTLGEHAANVARYRQLRP